MPFKVNNDLRDLGRRILMWLSRGWLLRGVDRSTRFNFALLIVIHADIDALEVVKFDFPGHRVPFFQSSF